jgi:cytochrome P450
LKSEITAKAELLVDRSVKKQEFCAAAELMGPSLDTTISAAACGPLPRIKLNGGRYLRRHRSSPSTVNEIHWMEAPIQRFSRLLARDYEMDGITLPAGSRAIASMVRQIETSANFRTRTDST